MSRGLQLTSYSTHERKDSTPKEPIIKLSTGKSSDAEAEGVEQDL